MNIAVIIVGFDRPKSLSRLFDNIKSCDDFDLVDIIFSIDKSSSQDNILKLVKSFIDNKENCFLRTFDQRLGLREHILSCGDMVENYDAVVVLEDDIVVSKCFLSYVFSALEFTKDDEGVAGISLYSPAINEMSLLPFSPKRTGFDNYYLQSAQSWGQCWSKRMWEDFRSWYSNNSSRLELDYDMPSRIYSWPETSWKKYYMKYLVEAKKTFFYPYDSLSSNYSDVGQHNKILTPYFQVPLISDKKLYNFGRIKEVPNYDIFFERLGLTFNGESLCTDLYGTKRVADSRFILTSKKIKGLKVKSYGLTYRPQEDNYLKNAEGNDVHLYDLKGLCDFEMYESKISFKLAKYHTNITWKHALLYSIITVVLKFLKKVKLI